MAKDLDWLIESIYQDLLPELRIHSIHPFEPIVIEHVPLPWQPLAAGNYAAVVIHPDYADVVIKIYAAGRSGFEEEVEVYRRIGSHPAFSECYYAKDGFLVLKRLRGVTLYDCLPRRLRIPKQVILDVDRALNYARDRGLYPHDIHGKNVMMLGGRGLVVDISDFLQPEPCQKWTSLKRAYYWFYRPLISPLRIPVSYAMLNGVRRFYRLMSRWLWKRH